MKEQLDQFNQSEKILKNEGLFEERRKELSDYLKRLEDVAKNSDIKEIQSGLGEYFPSTYHPFAPNGPDRPNHLTEENIKQFAFVLADASIDSIKESNWAVLQLSGDDMDLRDNEIPISKLEELINKRLEEKGIPDKKIVRIHAYPLYRQTTGQRPGPSEPGYLMIETTEKEQIEK